MDKLQAALHWENLSRSHVRDEIFMHTYVLARENVNVFHNRHHHYPVNAISIGYPTYGEAIRNVFNVDKH